METLHSSTFFISFYKQMIIIVVYLAYSFYDKLYVVFYSTCMERFALQNFSLVTE